jgi:malate synthase
VLNGKGASLLDGYMEDLATDRIYRLMIAQRMVHRDTVTIADGSGAAVAHTPEFVSRLFDDELSRLVASPVPGRDLGTAETMGEARRKSEELIKNGWFDPV